ncbi:MAG: DUF1839 family protein [Lacisediminihabitans sp.]
MAVTSLLPLDPATYEPHALHRTDRIWGETNCYVDIWIEVLHALDLEPLAASSFALATDFEGDQWTFFKFPPEDLRDLYGIRVFEMNPWQPVVDHVTEHLESGRLITIEVDSWYLPDTAGVSYRIEHTKTTIIPNAIDHDQKRLGYFHGPSYFELEGEDFDGVFRIGNTAQVDALPPYVETVRLDRLQRLGTEALLTTSRTQLAEQVARMPRDNPMLRFRARVDADLEWLRSAGIDGFHRWAFGTFRQCGASAEVGASYLEWLAHADQDEDLMAAASSLTAIARNCKSLEFAVARLARGRTVEIGPTFDEMVDNWATVSRTLVDRYGG